MRCIELQYPTLLPRWFVCTHVPNTPSPIGVVRDKCILKSFLSCIVFNSASGLKQEKDDIIYYAKNVEILLIATYVVPGSRLQIEPGGSSSFISMMSPIFGLHTMIYLPSTCSLLYFSKDCMQILHSFYRTLCFCFCSEEAFFVPKYVLFYDIDRHISVGTYT